MFLLWVIYIPISHFKVLSFGFLALILVSLVVDLFPRVDRNIIHWTWNLSSRVVLNFLWAISKPDIHIFFPPNVCGRQWLRCRLSVTACWSQLIYLIDIKYPLSSLHKIHFVDCWPFYISFTGSVLINPETCHWAWLLFLWAVSYWKYGFASPTGLWKVVTRVLVF